MRAAALLFLLSVFPAAAQSPGEPLPPWSPGTLDIHQINTGKGNSALLILPDGTSLLVDAGNGSHVPPRGTPPRPDSSRGAGEWIARYARHMLRHDASPAIDYAFLTHFHGDHMGGVAPDSKPSPSGAYKLTGLAEVAAHIPIRRMLDRGWPSYDYPRPVDDPHTTNYRAFVQWQTQNNGLKIERFRPGLSSQIVLLRDARAYPSFQIRNIAANGEIWTGVADNTRQHFPPVASLAPADLPSENMCSMAFRLTYGSFDFYTGGDMPGARYEWAHPWNDVETPVAQAVGPVDVSVLNHHGNRDSTNTYFLAALRPQVFLIPVWSSNHPGEDVIHRIYSTRIYAGPRDVFATNMIEANRIVVGEALTRLKSSQGHIVVRVAPGGGSFRVAVLDDSAETFRVTAVHGPYQSR